MKEELEKIINEKLNEKAEANTLETNEFLKKIRKEKDNVKISEKVTNNQNNKSKNENSKKN